MWYVNLKLQISVFLKKFGIFLFIYSYSLWKDLSRDYLFVSKFLLEATKFKENVLICVIFVIKVRDLLLTLLQVLTMLAA